MSLKRTALQIFFIIITTCSAIAQKQIDYQSDWGERRPSFPDCLILKSNVVFVHQDMTMSCDSAVFNTKDNFMVTYTFGKIQSTFTETKSIMTATQRPQKFSERSLRCKRVP